MTYKDWIIPELRGLEAKRSALKHIPEQIKALEMKYGEIKATSYDKDVVSGGENRREEKLIEVLLEKDQLRRNYERTLLEVKEADTILLELTEEQRTVLQYMFIKRQKNDPDRLAEILCCEKATVYRKRNDALINYARRKLGVVEL